MPDEPPPPRIKDVAVCSWVPMWDPKDSTSIFSFFKKIEAAAQMGGLTDQDKIMMVRMKLRGVAETYLNTHPDLQGEIPYERIKALLTERFREKHPDAYYFAQFQMARQKKDEDPEAFADRLRRLNERTMVKVETAEERKVLHDEAERRLLAQFVAGLAGQPGDQVRIQMPTTMEHAIRIAITATQAEEAKGVRDKVPSRAFGLTVAQSQQNSNYHSNNYRGRGRGRWGYNKRPEYGPRLGSRDQYQNSGRSDNIIPGVNNAHTSGTLGRGSNNSNHGIQCYRCHGFGHVALGCRGGQKGSPLNASGKRATPATSQEIAKPSIPSVLVSRLAIEPILTFKVGETDF